MVDIEKLVRPNILALKPYSSARDEYAGGAGIFLDANENPFGELNRYPDPHQRDLKHKLATLKAVNDNNIFVGNGSDEVIDLAFRIFCIPGVDKALTFAPTYGMYEVSSAINNIELLTIPLTTDFQIDVEKVKLYFADSSIKLLFICSPNNPTGNLMNKRDVEYILKNFNGIVIIDEAYIDFAKEASLISLIDQYNNLIVSQTFSKAWGLAAARVGLAYANSEVISLFNKVKSPYNVSKINQQAAIDALTKFEVYSERLTLILKEKERLIAQLQELVIVKKIYPSDANFLLLEVEHADSLYTALVAQHIITRNRSKQVENCIRISIGTPHENDELVKALKDI
ncbi:histidinol-phosphate transaminase [Williamwhitmania taraxaci]|uniref:Histidinol-phosphate aminotransferase n=1 Tax=Williamwhitmania taraxaci TaxID=1640674 RepID=A0A1G6PV17_9BACT|nr:histidinol-phosphate transaminase [Williamwhitmania taraxaci]SDC83963.1 histidinol-phosphate aminotransferase [Williamwhitmania taraxaci]